MSDESSRSARPSGQRRNDGAPTWWGALERSDLPDGDGAPAAHRRWYEDAEAAPAAVEVAATGAAQPGRRAWLIGVLVAAAVAVVLLIALVVDPPDALLVTMLLGVPLILVVITTLVVARRSR